MCRRWKSTLEKKKWKRIKETETQVRKGENRNKEDTKAFCFCSK
jgi:hypothetical protein